MEKTPNILDIIAIFKDIYAIITLSNHKLFDDISKFKDEIKDNTTLENKFLSSLRPIVIVLHEVMRNRDYLQHIIPSEELNCTNSMLHWISSNGCFESSGYAKFIENLKNVHELVKQKEPIDNLVSYIKEEKSTPKSRSIRHDDPLSKDALAKIAIRQDLGHKPMTHKKEDPKQEDHKQEDSKQKDPKLEDPKLEDPKQESTE
jgi:hypothetical protein